MGPLTASSSSDAPAGAAMSRYPTQSSPSGPVTVSVSPGERAMRDSASADGAALHTSTSKVARRVPRTAAPEFRGSRTRRVFPASEGISRRSSARSAGLSSNSISRSAHVSGSPRSGIETLTPSPARAVAPPKTRAAARTADPTLWEWVMFSSRQGDAAGGPRLRGDQSSRTWTGPPLRRSVTAVPSESVRGFSHHSPLRLPTSE